MFGLPRVRVAGLATRGGALATLALRRRGLLNQLSLTW